MAEATRKERIEALRRELADLKEELRKARGGFKRLTLQDEIRATARELTRLESDSIDDRL